jgi:hypothetical protein
MSSSHFRYVFHRFYCILQFDHHVQILTNFRLPLRMLCGTRPEGIWTNRRVDLARWWWQSFVTSAPGGDGYWTADTSRRRWRCIRPKRRRVINIYIRCFVLMWSWHCVVAINMSKVDWFIPRIFSGTSFLILHHASFERLNYTRGPLCWIPDSDVARQHIVTTEVALRCIYIIANAEKFD